MGSILHVQGKPYTGVVTLLVKCYWVYWGLGLLVYWGLGLLVYLAIVLGNQYSYPKPVFHELRITELARQPPYGRQPAVAEA